MPLVKDISSYGTISVMGEMNTVRVGKFCSLATGIIADGGFNHDVENISLYPFGVFRKGTTGSNTCKGDINIGNDVWIGLNSIIMSGVTIGDGAIIGSYSVVTKDVDAYSITAGNPAKHKKYRFPKGYRESLLRIKWWEWSEQKINENLEFLESHNIKEFILKHERCGNS